MASFTQEPDMRTLVAITDCVFALRQTSVESWSKLYVPPYESDAPTLLSSSTQVDRSRQRRNGPSAVVRHYDNAAMSSAVSSARSSVEPAPLRGQPESLISTGHSREFPPPPPLQRAAMPQHRPSSMPTRSDDDAPSARTARLGQLESDLVDVEESSLRYSWRRERPRPPTMRREGSVTDGGPKRSIVEASVKARNDRGSEVTVSRVRPLNIAPLPQSSTASLFNAPPPPQRVGEAEDAAYTNRRKAAATPTATTKTTTTTTSYANRPSALWEMDERAQSHASVAHSCSSLHSATVPSSSSSSLHLSAVNAASASSYHANTPYSVPSQSTYSTAATPHDSSRLVSPPERFRRETPRHTRSRKVQSPSPRENGGADLIDAHADAREAYDERRGLHNSSSSRSSGGDSERDSTRLRDDAAGVPRSARSVVDSFSPSAAASRVSLRSAAPSVVMSDARSMRAAPSTASSTHRSQPTPSWSDQQVGRSAADQNRVDGRSRSGSSTAVHGSMRRNSARSASRSDEGSRESTAAAMESQVGADGGNDWSSISPSQAQQAAMRFVLDAPRRLSSGAYDRDNNAAERSSEARRPLPAEAHRMEQGRRHESLRESAEQDGGRDSAHGLPECSRSLERTSQLPLDSAPGQHHYTKYTTASAQVHGRGPSSLASISPGATGQRRPRAAAAAAAAARAGGVSPVPRLASPPKTHPHRSHLTPSWTTSPSRLRGASAEADVAATAMLRAAVHGMQQASSAAMDASAVGGLVPSQAEDRYALLVESARLLSSSVLVFTALDPGDRQRSASAARSASAVYAAAAAALTPSPHRQFRTPPHVSLFSREGPLSFTSLDERLVGDGHRPAVEEAHVVEDGDGGAGASLSPPPRPVQTHRVRGEEHTPPSVYGVRPRQFVGVMEESVEAHDERRVALERTRPLSDPSTGAASTMESMKSGHAEAPRWRVADAQSETLTHSPCSSGASRPPGSSARRPTLASPGLGPEASSIAPPSAATADSSGHDPRGHPEGLSKSCATAESSTPFQSQLQQGQHLHPLPSSSSSSWQPRRFHAYLSPVKALPQRGREAGAPTSSPLSLALSVSPLTPPPLAALEYCSSSSRRTAQAPQQLGHINDGVGVPEPCQVDGGAAGQPQHSRLSPHYSDGAVGKARVAGKQAAVMDTRTAATAASHHLDSKEGGERRGGKGGLPRPPSATATRRLSLQSETSELMNNRSSATPSREPSLHGCDDRADGADGVTPVERGGGSDEETLVSHSQQERRPRRHSPASDGFPHHPLRGSRSADSAGSDFDWVADGFAALQRPSASLSTSTAFGPLHGAPDDAALHASSSSNNVLASGGGSASASQASVALPSSGRSPVRRRRDRAPFPTAEVSGSDVSASSSSSAAAPPPLQQHRRPSAVSNNSNNGASIGSLPAASPALPSTAQSADGSSLHGWWGAGDGVSGATGTYGAALPAGQPLFLTSSLHSLGAYSAVSQERTPRAFSMTSEAAELGESSTYSHIPREAACFADAVPDRAESGSVDSSPASHGAAKEAEGPKGVRDGEGVVVWVDAAGRHYEHPRVISGDEDGDSPHRWAEQTATGHADPEAEGPAHMSEVSATHVASEVSGGREDAGVPWRGGGGRPRLARQSTLLHGNARHRGSQGEHGGFEVEGYDAPSRRSHSTLVYDGEARSVSPHNSRGTAVHHAEDDEDEGAMEEASRLHSYVDPTPPPVLGEAVSRQPSSPNSNSNSRLCTSLSSASTSPASPPLAAPPARSSRLPLSPPTTSADAPLREGVDLDGEQSIPDIDDEKDVHRHRYAELSYEHQQQQQRTRLSVPPPLSRPPMGPSASRPPLAKDGGVSAHDTAYGTGSRVEGRSFGAARAGPADFFDGEYEEEDEEDGYCSYSYDDDMMAV